MPTLHVRDVPERIYETLKATASRDRRSLNAQVVEMLDRALQADADREAQIGALARIAERRRQTVLPPDGFDSLAMLREDRER